MCLYETTAPTPLVSPVCYTRSDTDFPTRQIPHLTAPLDIFPSITCVGSALCIMQASAPTVTPTDPVDDDAFNTHGGTVAATLSCIDDCDCLDIDDREQAPY